MSLVEFVIYIVMSIVPESAWKTGNQGKMTLFSC